MTETPSLQQWPRRPARLATAVIHDLVDRVVSGHFPAGGVLPTETVLGENFGVSRSVLREAIKALEAMGLVRVQQGQGTTALPMINWDLVNPIVLAAVIRHDAQLEILTHLVDVRRALESQMALRAAGIITDEQLALMDERYADLERQIDDPEAYSDADVAFHDAILAASGNALGRAIINVLTLEARRSLRYLGEPSSEDRRHSNIAHKNIRDAVANGDGELAAKLMDQHIADAWELRRPTRVEG